MMMSYKKTFSWKHTREKKKELGKEKFLMQKAKLDMTNSGLGDIQKGGIWREVTTSGLNLKWIKN